ncbi:IS66 family transposase [Paenibacillus phytorum]|uniref:IS66 family transposase n=1 Tax=Paenibacillus phytorum TaxID=2654977 RepID=UPI0035E42CE1
MNWYFYQYDYQRTRSGEHPQSFLSGFKGYLHVDGYTGYHKVVRCDSSGMLGTCAS